MHHFARGHEMTGELDFVYCKSEWYDLAPCHTIIQMFNSAFQDAAYCKDLYLFMVWHVHIFLCTFL
jgi:hypothetical protein